jgi:hypothetical protein
VVAAAKHNFQTYTVLAVIAKTICSAAAFATTLKPMRILAGILLGMWLAGSAVIAWTAAENFFMIDRLLDEPTNAAFSAAVEKLPNGEARMTLRYLSSELNRYYFSAWGWIGLGLGFALLAITTQMASRGLKAGATIMLGISAILVFYLTPQMVDVGRQLDYVLPTDAQPTRLVFGRLHAAYSSLELVKLVVGLWMCTVLIRRVRTP